jgi:hypothetical protein
MGDDELGESKIMPVLTMKKPEPFKLLKLVMN